MSQWILSLSLAASLVSLACAGGQQYDVDEIGCTQHGCSHFEDYSQGQEHGEYHRGSEHFSRPSKRHGHVSSARSVSVASSSGPSSSIEVDIGSGARKGSRKSTKGDKSVLVTVEGSGGKGGARRRAGAGKDKLIVRDRESGHGSENGYSHYSEHSETFVDSNSGGKVVKTKKSGKIVINKNIGVDGTRRAAQIEADIYEKLDVAKVGL